MVKMYLKVTLIPEPKNLTLNINKKQSNIGLITMGAGNLTIGLGANVTELLFADHSNATWGAGNLTISDLGII